MMKAFMEAIRVLLAAAATVLMAIIFENIFANTGTTITNMILYAILYFAIKNELDKHAHKDN